MPEMIFLVADAVLPMTRLPNATSPLATALRSHIPIATARQKVFAGERRFDLPPPTKSVCFAADGALLASPGGKAIPPCGPRPDERLLWVSLASAIGGYVNLREPDPHVFKMRSPSSVIRTPRTDLRSARAAWTRAVTDRAERRRR